MPEQETFFEYQAGNRRVKIVKTYDRSYAYEVFRSMDDDALRLLATALDINSAYDSADIPDPNGAQYAEFIWEELIDASVEDVRLDPNLRSFFVVSQSANRQSENLYVCADLPSAEAFAKGLMVRENRA